MREAVSSRRVGNGDGNDRLRRQNHRRGHGAAPQENTVHLRSLQASREQNPMRVSLQTKSHQLRVEAPLKASFVHWTLLDGLVIL